VSSVFASNNAAFLHCCSNSSMFLPIRLQCVPTGSGIELRKIIESKSLECLTVSSVFSTADFTLVN
jgi:hypothetical protein